MECGRPVVFFDKRFCGLNHEKGVLLRRHLEGLVIIVRDNKSPCHWSVTAQVHKKGEHGLVLDHHLASSGVDYDARSKSGCQDIYGIHVFLNVNVRTTPSLLQTLARSLTDFVQYL